MAGTTTYVQLVNKAIQEAGVDLASFLADGSDFITNTNAMLQRFSGWTSRAWKSIQQECYDWEFMEETAVVNLDPGFMYYTDGHSSAALGWALQNTSFDIYDQDATVAIPSVSVGTFTDLYGASTLTLPFGYFNISATSASPISFALKPGAEYFTASISALQITSTMTIVGTPAFGNTGLASEYDLTYGGTTYAGGAKVSSYDSGHVVVRIYPPAVKTAILANPNSVVLSQNGVTLISTASSLSTAVLSGIVVYKGYIYSWKSFDMDEEVQSTSLPTGDFQENIQEINTQSFKIIDYYAGAPAQELPLPFMPWESFRNAYSQPAAYPGVPRIISEDNTGRWQLYPQPQQRYTVKFDYIRQPQILTAFGDIPKGINDDFMDIIMWKTLIFYGEFDEQPSVVIRATKHYRDLLSRLEQKNREKFHLKPKRLW